MSATVVRLVLKVGGRYYAGTVDQEMVLSASQSIAVRFDSNYEARAKIRELWKLKNGREALGMRPVYLSGSHRIKAREPIVTEAADAPKGS